MSVIRDGNESEDSGFFDEAGLERHRTAFDFAGDLVVAILEADVFRFSARFKHLRAAAEFKVFD